MLTRLCTLTAALALSGCAFNAPPPVEEEAAPKERLLLTGSRIPHKVHGVSGTKVLSKQDVADDMRQNNRMPAQEQR